MKDQLLNWTWELLTDVGVAILYLFALVLILTGDVSMSVFVGAGIFILCYFMVNGMVRMLYKLRSNRRAEIDAMEDCDPFVDEWTEEEELGSMAQETSHEKS